MNAEILKVQLTTSCACMTVRQHAHSKLSKDMEKIVYMDYDVSCALAKFHTKI
jgi:hypothetical protein